MNWPEALVTCVGIGCGTYLFISFLKWFDGDL